MSVTYYLVHHKIFNLQEFYIKSKNFVEPTGIMLKTAFDCGQYSGFSIYEATDTTAETLKAFVDSKYGSIAHNVLSQIYPDTSGGWGSFQTIQDLKDKADAA